MNRRMRRATKAESAKHIAEMKREVSKLRAPGRLSPEYMASVHRMIAAGRRWRAQHPLEALAFNPVEVPGDDLPPGKAALLAGLDQLIAMGTAATPKTRELLQVLDEAAAQGDPRKGASAIQTAAVLREVFGIEEAFKVKRVHDVDA